MKLNNYQKNSNLNCLTPTLRKNVGNFLRTIFGPPPLDIIGHVAAAPDPLACLAAALDPLACPSRSARPPSLS